MTNIVWTKPALRAEILKRLNFAVTRDMEKDGSSFESAGLRSTADVASYFSSSVPGSQVARLLNEMCLDGEIDWFGKIEGLGNVSWWRVALPEQDTPEVEPADWELLALVA